MATRVSYKWRSKSAGDGQRSLTRRVLVGSFFTSLLRGAEAESSSFDLSLVDDPIVPRELFFVREHFSAPAVSAAGWKLTIKGAVANPVELPYDRMAELPKKVLPVTLECAENPVGGGLVSHAEWTGFSLASILADARVVADARYVRLAGADGFSRSIPIAKAMHADTLIAFGMNGEKLPVNHGFPVRAVIPGWYAMDSVKWLREVEVHTNEIENDSSYTKLTRSLLTGTRPAGAVTLMNVKSVFTRPMNGANLVGRSFKVRGAAWAGENRVQRVEISTNAGKAWHDARLDGESQAYAWVLWSFDWKIPTTGSHDLCVRAYDDHGRLQPADRPAERADNYEFNAYQTIRVFVK
jgi:sulfite oxidase